MAKLLEKPVAKQIHILELSLQMLMLNDEIQQAWEKEHSKHGRSDMLLQVLCGFRQYHVATYLPPNGRALMAARLEELKDCQRQEQAIGQLKERKERIEGIIGSAEQALKRKRQGVEGRDADDALDDLVNEADDLSALCKRMKSKKH